MENKITIITPQFDRTWELDYEYIPQDVNSFYLTIKNAPTSVLKGMGFSIWDTIKNVVHENKNKNKIQIIEIPILHSYEKFKMDIGIGNSPTDVPDFDAEILLFPGEWYNHIPEGFIVTGLRGEQYPFQNGKSDNDTRYGCLPYGIMRKII